MPHDLMKGMGRKKKTEAAAEALAPKEKKRGLLNWRKRREATEAEPSGAEAEVWCVDEEPLKKKRLTPKKKVDPFAIPPSRCDATIFNIQQPFVEVVYSDKLKPMEGDKVRDGKSMNAMALKTAIATIAKAYLLASKSSKAPASELGYRDLHTALVKSFWCLTRPRKEQTLTVHDILTLNNHKSEERVDGPEEHTDLDVVSDKVDVRNSICSQLEGRSSDDSVDVRLEGDEGECEAKENEQTKYDIKCQVYDEHIQGINKTIVVLLVECKWGSLTVEDIYQAAAYGCELIKKNLQKGRLSPLHLEVWNENSWRYAVLYPTGLILLKNEEVAEVKFSKSSNSSLTSRLEVRKCLNTKYSGFEYPDGVYLEGVLFISNERYALPGLWLRGSLLSVESRLFYQSMLRIIVGDRVLNWTSEHVTNAWKVRSDALTVELEKLMDG